VTVADDVSTGELNRRLDAHETRTDRIHGEQDARLTNLAKDMVPLGEWQRAERARDAELQRMDREHAEDLTELKDNVIKPLVGRVEKLEKRPGVAWGWVVAGGTLLITVLGVLVQAWAAAKGAK
jgi:hypothetical protein